MAILVELLSKAQISDPPVIGTEDPIPTEGMDIFLVFVVCVGIGLCNELVTCSEVSYRVCVYVCVCVCVCVQLCVI
jgi:hypothetical protein